MEAAAALSNLHLQPRTPRLLRRLVPSLPATSSSPFSIKIPSNSNFHKPHLVCSIKTSSSSSSSTPPPPPPNSASVESIASIFIRSACVVAVAALAIARLGHRTSPTIPAPVAPLVTQKESDTGVSDEEKERNLEEYLTSHPDDVEALRSLMEAKIKGHKLQDAVDVIDRLINLQPDEKEWPLLKGQVYIYKEDFEVAKAQFEAVLAKDPVSVAVYHGLVMAVSENKDELKEVLWRVEQAMEVCKKERRKEDVRDFKLLIAQIRVTEGEYNEALKVYRELVKEEPRDFRPYLCQGMIYTLLRKSDEAEKCFQKYKRLVPNAHPYVQFFNDDMIATKVFSQKVAREAASSKS